MTEKEFIKIINSLVECIEFRNNVASLINGLKYVNRDFIGEDIFILPLDDTIIDLTSKLLSVGKDDKVTKEVKEIIQWWLYDANCGKDSEYNVVIYKDGTEKRIETPEELWEDIQTFIT